MYHLLVNPEKNELYMAGDSGSLASMNIETGDTLWTWSHPDFNALTGQVLSYDWNKLWVSNNVGSITELDIGNIRQGDNEVFSN